MTGCTPGDGSENEAKTAQKPEFPRFLMRVNGEEKFMSIQEAGVNFDNGFVQVEIGGLVLLDGEEFCVRRITPAEESEISDIADRHSSSK